jgi:hypothetical protein
LNQNLNKNLNRIELNHLPHILYVIIFLQSVEREYVQEMFKILSNILKLPEIFLISDERVLKILTPE